MMCCLTAPWTFGEIVPVLNRLLCLQAHTQLSLGASPATGIAWHEEIEYS